MKDFFRANTTKTVTVDAFLQKAGVPFAVPEVANGPAYLTGDIWRRLSSAVLVYGTVLEAGANRFAAEQLQSRFLDRYESQVPIYKDFEATEDVLRHRDVVFVGRPESNSALSAWAGRLGLDYPQAAFQIDGKWHASERDALVFAATNPLDASHMVLIYAGNDALRTVKSLDAGAEHAQYVLLEDGKPHAAFLKQP
jgi:hypothetical protein